MRGYRNQFPSLELTSHGGPLALIDGTPSEADIALAARIVGRYSQGRDAAGIALNLRSPQGQITRLHAAPMDPDDIPDDWLI
jgi:hypothetical protein